MKTIFLYLDYGLAIAYFFETELINRLLEKNLKLVFLVQDELVEIYRERYDFGDRVLFESMREEKTLKYEKGKYPLLQNSMNLIRKATASTKISLNFIDTHYQRELFEAKGKRRFLIRALRPIIIALRHSKLLRKTFNWIQNLFVTNIFIDLFEKYSPDLVVSNSAGWKLDRYLLREAKKNKIKTAVVIVGWDNPGHSGMPGADVDYALVWSEIQKTELSDGYDWPKEKILIGGMPLYDNYFNKKWLISRKEYFKEHKLDPNKKLISFISSALNTTPNYHLIKMMCEIIENEELNTKAQLLIRMHPNHFKPFKHYADETKKIFKLIDGLEHIHLVEPVAPHENLPRYSIDDFPEKASMLKYSDIIVTVASTMVVEASIVDTASISVCIDSPYDWEEKFTEPLSKAPGWPTTDRIKKAKASKLVFSREDLINSLNLFLSQPGEDKENREQFLKNEITYTNGTAAEMTAKNIISLLDD